ncbi:MAG: hypothetical protein QOH72_4635 [Solirubrobacteraceae bacterium]|jgi:hypothetical protein|nr:hypothetical protein [Solirubrobacteraceae bacterium]
MTGGAGGPSPGEPPRAKSERPRPAAQRARGAASGIGGAWRALTADQKLAAIAAIALLVSMLLPWYQETGFVNVNGKVQPFDDSKNAFQVYSFVEAAVFVVSAGVLALLYARGHRRAFHLPGGDGTVILGAGLWVMFLLFYRQLDKPSGRHEGLVNISVGVEWGIFVAFLLGALLAFAGYRIRATHTPEPVVDDAPAPTTPGAPAPSSSEPSDWLDEEKTHVAERPQPRRPDAEPLDGQLSFDEPAEYRPPPRRT